MRPYFSVGEEVILCSKRYPGKNGDYTINKILFRGDKFICRITGILVEYDGSLGYLLDSPIIDVLCRKGTEAIWPQSSLRKKHRPADQSFSDLIKSTREIKL